MEKRKVKSEKRGKKRSPPRKAAATKDNPGAGQGMAEADKETQRIGNG
jgi:hypothetical protein